MPQGDILFYSHTGLLQTAIKLVTHSRFTHTAIDVGDGTIIQAIDKGIAQTTYEPAAVVWHYRDHTTDFDREDLAQAMTWLLSMVGKPYGVSDLIGGLNIFSRFLYFAKPDAYDCSALATEFLVKAGGVDLGELGLDPHLATPGSLARQLGVE